MSRQKTARRFRRYTTPLKLVLGSTLILLAAKPSIILPDHGGLMSKVRLIQPKANEIGKKWKALEEPLSRLTKEKENLERCESRAERKAKRKARKRRYGKEGTENYVRRFVKKACSRQRKKVDEIEDKRHDVKIEAWNFCRKARDDLGDTTVVITPTNKESRDLDNKMEDVYDKANCRKLLNWNYSYSAGCQRGIETFIRLTTIIEAADWLILRPLWGLIAPLFRRRKKKEEKKE